MKRSFLYLIIMVSLSAGKLNAQYNDTIPGPEELLGTLYGRLVNNFNDTVRIRVNDSIKVIVDSYVRSDSVFNHRFSGLRYLGQIMSPDSAIKIVTWNLVLGNSPGKYYCYIIKKGAKGEKNRVYTLASDYRESGINKDTTYSIPDWYGALYYEVRPYMTNNIKCWILLGIDYGNQLISRKIIEVLSFTPEGALVLGKKWFEDDKKLRFREILEYGSSGMITLRFASEKSIVFDHLVPFSPSQAGDRQYYGPDYSYDAYNLTDGIWKLKINVDARNKE